MGAGQPGSPLHPGPTVAAVYDVTLNFRGNKNPSLLGILYGKRYEADMCLRRFPLEEIPQDEKEAAQWLHKLYQEKVRARPPRAADGRGGCAWLPRLQECRAVPKYFFLSLFLPFSLTSEQ